MACREAMFSGLAQLAYEPGRRASVAPLGKAVRTGQGLFLASRIMAVK